MDHIRGCFMETQACSRCGRKKSASEFYVRRRVNRSGQPTQRLHRQCKACLLEAISKRYRRRRPPVPRGHKKCPRCLRVLPVEQFGVNRRQPSGRQVYCLECWPIRVREMYVQRRRREGKELREEKAERLKKQRVLRRSAREYLNLAVYFGHVKIQPCEACGAEEVQAHHDDYTRPLDVRWLCGKHHAAVHGGRPTGQYLNKQLLAANGRKADDERRQDGVQEAPQ